MIFLLLQSFPNFNLHPKNPGSCWPEGSHSIVLRLRFSNQLPGKASPLPLPPCVPQHASPFLPVIISHVQTHRLRRQFKNFLLCLIFMKWNVGVRNPHDLGIKSCLFEMVTLLKGKDFLHMKKKKARVMFTSHGCLMSWQS